MSTTAEIVNQWLETKDFSQGVEILFAFRPQMARIFRGREKTYAGKLEYELKKLANIPTILTAKVEAKPVIEETKKQKAKTSKKKLPKPAKLLKEPASTNQPGNIVPVIPSLPAIDSSPLVKTKGGEAKTPAFIAKIIKEHAKLFKLRSQLADEREKVPQQNHPTHNKKRKILSESIQQHSERIEALYQAKEDYYNNGTMPDMAKLFPE